MLSYDVSTPRWTCRVDVCDGRVQRSSARYLRTVYGRAWSYCLGLWRQRYGSTLRVVELATQC